MPDQNLRIGWIGFHQEGIPALLGLKQAGIRLEAIITLDSNELAKRSAAVSYADVLADWDTPVYRVRSINDNSSIELLQSLNLDLLFVIGWSQILGSAALSASRLGAIGAHASMLPHNRGSAPINWALIHGESSSGNSLIWLTEEVDEGGIIDQTEFPITPYDTCETLYEKVALSNHLMIQTLLPKLFAGERPNCKQPKTDQPVLPRRRPSDGLLNWNQPANEIYNFVRALTRPYPGAFSFLDGVCWKIQSCVLLPDVVRPNSAPGTILGSARSPVEDACGLFVSGGTGSVIILEIESSDGAVLKGRSLSDQPWTGKVWTNE